MTSTVTAKSDEQGNRFQIKSAAPLLFFVLTACGDGPVDIDDMSRTMSAQLQQGITTKAVGGGQPVGFSGGFGPTIAKAVAANEGYRAAIAREMEALALVGVADSVRRPQLAGNAVAGGNRETGASATAGIAGGLDLSQLIYDGGASVAGVNRATAEALATRAERAALANDLALEAAKAWIDVWQFNARLGLLRERTAEMTTVVDQIDRMASTGLLDRADLDSALRQIVGIQLEESRLLADLTSAQVSFRRHFGVITGKIPKPEGIIRASQARSFAVNWQEAPQIQGRAAAVIAASNAVSEAEAAFRSRVRLQAGARSPRGSREPSDMSVGFAIEYSFSDGGLRARRLEAAKAAETAQREQMAEAQIALEAALKSALARLDGLDRSIPLIAEQIRLSASEAQTARSQIATGQSTLGSGLVLAS